jgi:uncharacterized protein YndB with AHSA1/START domain
MSEKPPEHVGRVVRKEIRIEADPERVWEAWAHPDKIAQWFVDRAEGTMEPGAVVTWYFDFFGMRLPVTVYATERGRMLTFGGEAPGRPAALQEVHLVKEGGTTILRLANSGFGSGPEADDELGGVDSGWELALATLKHWLETKPAGKAWSHLTLRPAKFEYEDLQPYFRTQVGLKKWLGDEVEIAPLPLNVESGVRVAFAGGRRLTGKVLAVSNREVLLTWPETEGTLGLKCFAMGPGTRALCLHVRAWPQDPAALADVPALLDRAVERLAHLVAAV